MWSLNLYRLNMLCNLFTTIYVLSSVHTSCDVDVTAVSKGDEHISTAANYSWLGFTVVCCSFALNWCLLFWWILSLQETSSKREDQSTAQVELRVLVPDRSQITVTVRRNNTTPDVYHVSRSKLVVLQDVQCTVLPRVLPVDPCHTRQLVQATWSQPTTVHATGPLWLHMSNFSNNVLQSPRVICEHSDANAFFFFEIWELSRVTWPAW